MPALKITDIKDFRVVFDGSKYSANFNTADGRWHFWLAVEGDTRKVETDCRTHYAILYRNPPLGAPAQPGNRDKTSYFNFDSKTWSPLRDHLLARIAADDLMAVGKQAYDQREELKAQKAREDAVAQVRGAFAKVIADLPSEAERHGAVLEAAIESMPEDSLLLLRRLILFPETALDG